MGLDSRNFNPGITELANFPEAIPHTQINPDKTEFTLIADDQIRNFMKSPFPVSLFDMSIDSFAPLLHTKMWIIKVYPSLDLYKKIIYEDQQYNAHATHCHFFIYDIREFFLLYLKFVSVIYCRFQCMRVALDAIHWFVVCVDEQNKAPRHWDQSQIEHIYSWLVRFPDVGLIDLYPGNGFYALAAGALNRTSIVIESQLDNLQRIQKGMSISGLSKKVHLYSPKVIMNGKCASTTDPLQCGNQNQTINTYDVILSLNPAKKIILRARFDRDTGDMLMKSQQIFKNLCIPLVISEINNDLVKQNLTALRQLADSLVTEYGYRPFTYNGIALALNNIAEWPGVVYWMSKFDVE